MSSTTSGLRSVEVFPSSFPARDVLEQAAHDLARARLGQFVREDDFFGLGDRPDRVEDGRHGLLLEFGVSVLVAVLGDGVDVDGLAFDLVVAADDGGFGDSFDADDGRLDLHRSQPVAGDVDHVVDPAEDGDVVVVVDLRAVLGEVDPLVGLLVGVLLPVLREEPLVVVVQRAKHAGPGLLTVT